MAIITAAEARSLIPGLSGTGEDAALVVLASQVDAFIADYVGMPLPATGHPKTMESASYTLYREGLGGRFLWLPVTPVTAVTSIHDDTGLTYGSDSLVDSGDYTLHGTEGLVLLTEASTHGSWSVRVPRAIKVSFTAGFAATPAPLKRAAERLVQHWWSARYSGTRESVSRGGASARMLDADMPADVQSLLAPYMVSGWAGVS